MCFFSFTLSFFSSLQRTFCTKIAFNYLLSGALATCQYTMERVREITPFCSYPSFTATAIPNGIGVSYWVAHVSSCFSQIHLRLYLNFGQDTKEFAFCTHLFLCLMCTVEQHTRYSRLFRVLALKIKAVFKLQAWITKIDGNVKMRFFFSSLYISTVMKKLNLIIVVFSGSRNSYCFI